MSNGPERSSMMPTKPLLSVGLTSRNIGDEVVERERGGISAA
jgi:hypothetical protein